MRKSLYFTFIIGVLASASPEAFARVTGIKELADGAQFTIETGTLRVQFWSPEIVRVTYAATAEQPRLNSLSVIASPEAPRWKWQQNNHAFTLATARLKVRINKETGAVSFLSPAEGLLLQERVDGRKIEPATISGTPVTSCTESFDLAPDEGVYGLGQHQRGIWN